MSAAAWRAVDRQAVNYGTSGEQIARAALLQIFTNLEGQCQVQDNLWIQRDIDWAQMRGIQVQRTRINRPAKTSFFSGLRPSLVESRFDLWPAVAVYCGPRNPSDAREQPDQYDVMDLQLVIDVLAVAGPFDEVVKNRDPDDEIDRQYQRLADAVVSCISIDKTLGSNILPIKLPPRMVPSAPFVRPVEKGSGQNLLFQGMEITYVVTAQMY